MVTAEVCAERISDVLRRVYGETRCAAKRIGRRVHAHPRAVQNWLDGSNAPRLAEAIRLAAECDELAVELIRIIEEARCAARSSSK